MFKYGTAITIAAILFASSASAFDPIDLEKLAETGNCVECDLSGADLSGADLEQAYIMRSDLSGANLFTSIFLTIT
jgi:uncharacterized protein YjbI with pentapeptide repeats